MLTKRGYSYIRFLAICAAGVLMFTSQPVLSYSKHSLQTKTLHFHTVSSKKKHSVDLAHTLLLKQFYEDTSGELIWMNKDTQDLRDVVAVLENAWSHGLNPENYHIDVLKASLDAKKIKKREKAKLELLLSDAVLSYSFDVKGRRIEGIKPINLIASEIENIDGEQPVTAQDQMDNHHNAKILHELSDADDVAKYVEGITHKSPLYNKLREELIKLSAVDSSHDYLLPLGFGTHHFTPGKRHADVVSLRRILNVNSEEGHEQDKRYSGAVVEAVKEFQAEHNLLADGIIGPKTLKLINRTTQDKMEQVVVNMERLRAERDYDAPRYITVNIPSQTLWAIDEGKVVHEMPVVVGSKIRKTVVFETEITGVRLNPTWTVPLKLKMQDMLPKLKKDPYALEAKKIDIRRGVGRNTEYLDPGQIDWHNMSWKEMNKLRMVQVPGDHNALGRYRVLMPNKYDIYLHDTNHKELFAREDRTLSSGCIRLSQPDKIARFILARHEGWSEGKMQEVLASGRMTDVEIKEPFPVYITYKTMWQDENGKLVYGPDVYNKDKKILETMTAMNAYKLPDATDNQLAMVEAKTAVIAE